MKSPANINISGRKRIAQETNQVNSKNLKPETALQIETFPQNSGQEFPSVQLEDGHANYVNEDGKEAMEEEPESPKVFFSETTNTDDCSESETVLRGGDNSFHSADVIDPPNSDDSTDPTHTIDQHHSDDDIDPLHSDEATDPHHSGDTIRPSHSDAIYPLNYNVAKDPPHFDDARDSHVAKDPNCSGDAIVLPHFYIHSRWKHHGYKPRIPADKKAYR